MTSWGTTCETKYNLNLSVRLFVPASLRLFVDLTVSLHLTRVAHHSYHYLSTAQSQCKHRAAIMMRT